MPRSDRILLFVLGGALLAWALLARGGDEAPLSVRAAQDVAESELPAERTDYEQDYAAFASALQAFRSGEAQDPRELRATAARLARRHDRDDAPRVAEYYASLTPSERRIGLDDFEEFLGLWTRVAQYDGENWDEDLPLLREELRELAARLLPRADFVPAGRALSLLAELEVQWLEFLEDDDELRPELLEAAARHAREALAVFERAWMLTPRLEPLLNVGRLDLLEGREQIGRHRFELCLELAEVTRQDEFRELALVRLIRLARDAGDLPLEDELMAELATFRNPQESWELAHQHALRLIHQDEAPHAAEFLIAHRPEADDERDDWRILMAIARLRTEEWAEARRWIEALEARENDEDALLLRATLNLREGDSAAVLLALDSPEGLQARSSAHGRRDAAALVGEAHLLEGRPALALESLREARRIAESWEARLEEETRLAATSASVIGEWLGLHAVVVEARALLQLERPLEAALLIERAHSSRWRGAAGDSLTDEDLRAWAATYGHGLVTWISGADSGVVVHVASDGVAHGREVPVSRKALKRGTRRLRGALIAGDEMRGAELSRELVEALLPESLVDSLLDPKFTDDRLLCLAHGAIEDLPLEALQLEGLVLDEHATILVLPELRARRPGPSPGAGQEWSLLGGPIGTGGEVRLPAALLELAEIAALRPSARLSSRDDFDRAALVEALASGRALHVATHLVDGAGCEAQRFADVGLELSGGGALCASEIAELGTRAPLVVLAACETAGGRRIDARGQQGLARAFLEAGARDLLVTLWPIRDEAARRFTLEFHAALLGGESPSQAARLARRRLAESGVMTADWAAFRVLGRD